MSEEVFILKITRQGQTNQQKTNNTSLNHLLLEVQKLCYSIKCSSFHGSRVLKLNYIFIQL